MVLGTRDTSMNERTPLLPSRRKRTDKETKPSMSPSLLILAKNHSFLLGVPEYTTHISELDDKE